MAKSQATTQGKDAPSFHSSRYGQAVKRASFISSAIVILYLSYTLLFNQVTLLAGAREAAALSEATKTKSKSTKVPQYFQTSPELWAGPTATGKAPFLAETNPVSFAATATFVPSTPLETAVPISGQGQNQSIFHLMGQLSPYFPNPEGFGVAEYPLPPGANISQVQVSSVP